MMTPLQIIFNNLELEGLKVLAFGKHKGSTYQHVYLYDKGYCKWCLSLSASSFSMYDFQSYLEKIQRFF